MGQYEGRIRRKLPNLKQGVHDYSKKAGRDREAVRVVQERDGILFPAFRLPTEAEWEYAALGLVENTDAENVDERRLYPWDGDGVRNAGNKNKGEIVANFKRGRGDNMGIASKLNDQGDIPVPTRTYWPNAFGLYNMAGNVSEWVMDVYRPLIDQTTTDLNPYRGNVYQTWTRDEDRFLIEKDSLGQMIKRNVTVEENMGRRNYSSSDNINFEDGDYDSQLKTDDWLNDPQTNTTNDMYEFGTKSLITDNSRVYKGGSWNDRAYWMVPGTRRFLNQSLSTATIGFRCAMDRLGPPVSQLKENQRKPVDWERRKGY
jgi:sulfatase modifying factor 1